MTFTYSKDGLHNTEHFEGLSLKAYPDPGTGGAPWTIGYGHTGPEVHPGMVITQDQAEAYLMADVQKAADFVNKNVKSNITQPQFDALVDFAFNCGCGNLANSTLLKKINAGDMHGAAEEFPTWNKAAGHVMAGLVKRREAEVEMFLKGMA